MFAIRRKPLIGAMLALGASLVLTGAGPEGEGVRPGDKAPDFTLKDVNGQEHKLSAILQKEETKAVVLEWFNPDCPYVVRHHQKDKTMPELAEKYKGKGVVWLAINSGTEGNQGAGLERNQRAVKEFQIKYPVLMDGEQDAGLAYGAKTTPHMFVITPDGRVAYAGAIDNAPRGKPANDEEKINYVERALEAVLTGSSVETASSKAYGCAIKY